MSDLDPVLVGEPLWTLQKDGHSAEARVRAIAGIGLELRFSIVGTAGASCAGEARGLRREGLARAISERLRLVGIRSAFR